MTTPCATLEDMAGNSSCIDSNTHDSGSRRRRGRAAVALGLSAVLALAGCSKGSEDADGNGTPDAQETAHGLTVAGQWPLTGEPAKGEAPGHPVMIVKIDNTESSSP